MQIFRVFVSSPGDVMVERRRVENVVSRLNGEFASVARLEAIRWETEAYQAFSTFQAQIPRSTECDLVVGILKWRLGTELSPDFPERLPDRRPYPSGTAYEILTAVERRQRGGALPDIYVFRFAGSSPSVAVDDPNRAAIERDWQALKGFFQEWFVTERGHFKAAFNLYDSEDDFETQLDKLLRKWVADKVAAGRVVRWPVAVKGSPFRGLGAFGAKHAPVFFGRNDDTARAVDRWREAGGRGSPYLLVVGASGAGKSSLARAGLVPRLTTPGVIKDVDAWRVAAMRPGDDPAGPFGALATALMQDEAGLPREEEGRGPALPEIAAGDSRTPADLAVVLRHADAAAARSIVNALSRVGEGERNRERYGREVRCDLILLIDQFEELFASSVSASERTAFFDLLAALVKTGRVWVAATLRADFYAPMLGEPALKKLKELGATYDLAPPGPAELAEIVRAPAEAAGLAFETDTETGEHLDARLLRDADHPDMLPLVQLALTRLFEGRASAAGDMVLRFKVYEALGGLKGIVEEAGETALAPLREAERAWLPRLLRQLAVPAQDRDGTGQATLTIRSVPLKQAAPNETARKLLDALVAARLLTTSGIEADAQVRLAHQRVLEDWARARAMVAESADFYRVRADLEDSRRKWDAGNQRRELLLARGLPLAEAESIVGRHRDELPSELLAYVRASRTRANRAQMIGWAAAAVFFLLAIGAGVAAKVAFDQRTAAEAARARAEQETQRADRNFAAAKRTVDELIFNIAQGLRNVVGMRVDSVRRILDTVQATSDQLIQVAPDDPQLLRSRAVMFVNFTETYLAAGDVERAGAAADQAVDILRKLAAQDAGNARAQLDLGVGLEKLGDVRLRGGNGAGALAAYQEELDIDRNLAAHGPGNKELQRALAVSLEKIGDVKLQGGDWAGALAAYQESLDIDRNLAAQDPASVQAQEDLALSLVKLGDVVLRGGDRARALAAYQEGLEVSRRLAARNPGNADVQRDVALALEKLGDVKQQQGDWSGALAAYEESLDVRRKRVAQDPDDASAQRDVAVTLNRIGDVKMRNDDLPGALAPYEKSLEIARRLAAQDQGSAQAQRDLSVSLERIGVVKFLQGDWARALTAFQESLDIRRKLAARDSGNAQARRDISLSLREIGDVKLKEGDTAGALAAYQEALDITRKLAIENPGDAQAQIDLVVNLIKLGSTVVDPAQGRIAATEALAILEKLDREGKLTGPQKNLLTALRKSLSVPP